jgi:N-methylhydantoinase A
VCSPETAAREPVRLLLSGPSGGAMAALGLSRALGEPNIIGVDMGGTSFDVSTSVPESQESTLPTPPCQFP